MIWHISIIVLGVGLVLMGLVNIYTGVTALLPSARPAVKHLVEDSDRPRTSSWTNR